MKINYRQSESKVAPEVVDTTTSPNGVYLRKDIQEVERAVGEDVERYYVYQEAFLTNEEYAIYSNTDKLTMTALDFIKVLKSLGITSEQIHNFLDTHEDLKDELTFCQNVYCGVVKQLCPLTVGNTTITVEIVEQAFKAKNGII